MNRFRALGLIVAAAAAGWAVARSTARQPDPPPAIPVPRPALPGPESYTAFPDLDPPMIEMKDYRGPDGQPLKVLNLVKMFGRLNALLARPVPADAPPLRKVRLAQVYEGTVYLYRFQEQIRLGRFQPPEYETYMKIVSEVYRAAAELEDTPAGKVALFEDRVRLLEHAERYVEPRVITGTDKPYTLNEARFFRLQAEAELLKLKGG
jgi:hypothetical protein